jgi:putative peptide zinc metalloprotease protein
VSKQVASLFKPLFFPPVVLAALAGLVMFDSWLFLHHGVAQAFRQSMEHPAIMVPLLGMIILSAGWHEFGHAAGCAYGGACPGAMGAGIYLAYPAFYTDVTDSYRLGRAGRLRTDLAGVYFNGLFILATAGLYAATHWEALLLVIVVQHIEAAHQLLPFLRLDGYYIVADLTGVPDLFSRIRPILASSLPWIRTDPKVKELKLWARLVVTFWVVLVVPLLLFQLLMLLLHAPRILATAGHSLAKQAGAVGTAFGHADVAGVAVGALQILILLLPLIGIVLTLGRLGTKAGRGIWRGTEGKPVSRALAVLAVAALVGGLAYTWLPNGDYERIRPGERGTLREGVAAVANAPTGRPSLVSEQKAADAGRLVVPRGEEVPVSTSSTTVPPRSATSTTVAANRRTSTTVEPATTEPSSTTTTTVRRTTTTAGA